MFSDAFSFDANLSLCNVSNVIDMSFMFYAATNFIGIGLDKWILHPATDVSNTFCGATAFNRSFIEGWNITTNVFCELDE